LPKTRPTYCKDDIKVALVLYSTFEPLDNLHGYEKALRSITSGNEHSPTPTLYVSQISNVLGLARAVDAL
jgi:hypothetical protein